MKIYFTGGGTGGHVFPGIAVLEKWCEKMNQTPSDITWIGSPKSIESKIAKAHGVKFKSILCGKLRRYFSLWNFVDIFKFGIGFVQVFFFLLFRRPSVIFSKGGYVSVAPCIAARILRIPFVSHESDITPGLATKINSRFADLILTAYDVTSSLLSKRVRAKAVGNPVRAFITQGEAKKGKEFVKAPKNKKLVLVIGGSQGAEFLNHLIEESENEFKNKYYFVHQTGPNNYKPYQSKNRITFPFFNEEIADIYAACDLVVCRAGANTLWENGVCKKPAILIPLGSSSSRGDQIINAEYFEKDGAAIVLPQEDCTKELFVKTLSKLAEDEAAQNKMKKALGKICNLESASQIVDEILLLLESRALKK